MSIEWLSGFLMGFGVALMTVSALRGLLRRIMRTGRGTNDTG